jgi:hypothetical protein
MPWAGERRRRTSGGGGGGGGGNESFDVAKIAGMVVKSKIALCVVCCCCLVLTLQFAVIGLFIVRDHVWTSFVHVGGGPAYYHKRNPPRKVGGVVEGNAAGNSGKVGIQSSALHLPALQAWGADLQSLTLADFEARARDPDDGSGDYAEKCGSLLLGSTEHHHDFTCRTIGGRCCCQSASHMGVWTVPTVSLLGAQKGGSTALLAYLMLVPGYRNAQAKELHFFDRTEVCAAAAAAAAAASCCCMRGRFRPSSG